MGAEQKKLIARDDKTYEANRIMLMTGREHPEMKSMYKPEYRVDLLSPFVHPRRVLILAPHFDDDVEFGGGIAQLLIAKGIPITFAVFTDGREGLGPYTKRNRITGDTLVKIRKDEFQKAICFLGADSPLVEGAQVSLVPDMQLASYYDHTQSIIRSLIKKSKPGYLIGPNPKDYHPDHNALGKAMLEVAEDLDITALTHDTQFGKTYLLDQNAYAVGKAFEIPDTDDYFRQITVGPTYEPGLLVKIPPHMQWRKLRADLEYESQMEGQDFPERIAQSNALRGKWIGEQWAEGFDLAFQSKYGVIDPFTKSFSREFVYKKVKQKGSGISTK